MPTLASLHVKVSSSEQRETLVDVDDSQTVAELKSALQPRVSISAGQQRLIYKGRVLVDTKTLAEYGAPRRRVRASLPACVATGHCHRCAPHTPRAHHAEWLLSQVWRATTRYTW